MKNKLLILLVCIICISASVTTSVLVVRPAKPISTMVIVTYGDNVQSIVYQYVKLGYIVKSVSAPSSNYNVSIVMEKY